MNFTDFISGDLGKQVIDNLSSKTGISSKETAAVVQQAGPALLEKLQQNALSPKGGESLLNALSKHDGGIFDNLASMFGDDKKEDGNGILNHILGEKKAAFESGISKKTGVSSGNVSQILMMLAPVIMGYLGKQTKEKGASSMDLGGLLGSVLGGNSGGGMLGSILEQVTDAPKGKSGGLGGLLGGLGSLFGKK